LYIIVSEKKKTGEKTGGIIFVPPLLHRKKPSVLVHSKAASRTENVQISNVTS